MVKKNIPTDTILYNKVKKIAKQKFNVWPSAYASGWLVKEYKKRGGKYKVSKTKSKRRRSKTKSKTKSKRRRSTNMGISRWFKEEWIDVCELPKIVPCGRTNSRKSKRSYPYCRPRYKITKSTPRIAKSFSKTEIKKRCSRKKRNPSKKILD